MSRTKYGITAVCGVGLLLIGVPQLPLELSNEIHAIFSLCWIAITLLTVVANWRRMIRLDLYSSRQEETKRRKQWLEADRKLRQVVGRNQREQKRGMQTV